MKFKIDDAEEKAIEQWQKKQMKKDPIRFTLGERWEYRFLPTGLGIIVSILDGATGDILEVRGTELF
jgi:hypothetical protein